MGQNMTRWHLVHHKHHIDCLGIGNKFPQWQDLLSSFKPSAHLNNIPTPDSYIKENTLPCYYKIAVSVAFEPATLANQTKASNRAATGFISNKYVSHVIHFRSYIGPIMVTKILVWGHWENHYGLRVSCGDISTAEMVIRNCKLWQRTRVLKKQQ